MLIDCLGCQRRYSLAEEVSGGLADLSLSCPSCGATLRSRSPLLCALAGGPTIPLDLQAALLDGVGAPAGPITVGGQAPDEVLLDEVLSQLEALAHASLLGERPTLPVDAGLAHEARPEGVAATAQDERLPSPERVRPEPSSLQPAPGPAPAVAAVAAVASPAGPEPEPLLLTEPAAVAAVASPAGPEPEPLLLTEPAAVAAEVPPKRRAPAPSVPAVPLPAPEPPVVPGPVRPLAPVPEVGPVPVLGTVPAPRPAPVLPPPGLPPLLAAQVAAESGPLALASSSSPVGGPPPPASLPTAGSARVPEEGVELTALAVPPVVAGGPGSGAPQFRDRPLIVVPPGPGSLAEPPAGSPWRQALLVALILALLAGGGLLAYLLFFR
ncbi:MAG: hypothetical protein RBU45_21865 [Myxococcota bacterium]|jgi:hypothetical protein|nr:hypothetical protein [Myxococcota bacterium]